MAATPTTALDVLRAEQSTLIGGSSIQHVFNIEPYGCARQKVYQLRDTKADRPFHGNNATSRGLRLEDFAADMYAEETGFNVRRVAGGLSGVAKRDPDFPYRGCHSDREIVAVDINVIDPAGKPVNPERSAGLLSIKTRGEAMFRKIKQEGIPKSEVLQLQYEMGIWDRQWGVYCFYWPDGDQIRHFAMRRDDQLVQEIYKGVDDLWARKENGPLPEKLKPGSRACKSCPFEPTCQGEELRAMYADEEAGDMPYDVSLADLVQERKDREELKTEADRLWEEINDKIRESMALKGFTAVETEGARIYNRFQDGRESFQKAQFAKAHPEMKDEIAKFTSKGKPFQTLRVYAR